ncbi:adenine deaminase [Thermophagus sp. OGC60D27]|uniref:adenine deaminase n=1 Tax=Thermophagus sp. OGC60D27 TaxID=3458415 RepID=UPI0040376BC3
MNKISGNIIDIHNFEIYPGEVCFSAKGINKIRPISFSDGPFILPGLIDAHVHIESSMLVPSGFSRLVVPRGTIGVVTDPHEIGNVLGVKGVEYMIEEAKNTPLKVFFGAPSCVPATNLESSGAVIGPEEVEYLLDKKEIYLLSEMMNYVGVVHKDKDVWRKIESALDRHLPVDGHVPGIMGEDLKKYASAGISTDHECFTLKEALEKIKNGMKIQIRQGSAAKNFDALAPLFDSHPDVLMLCTDDSHPHELIKDGHIDKLIKIGIEKGIDVFKLLRAASLIPVEYYKLPVGLLREGDPADFIVIDDPSSFNVLESYINGEKVFDHTKGVLFDKKDVEVVNHFIPHVLNQTDIEVSVPEKAQKVNVIQCFDGSLVTEKISVKPWDSKILKSNIDNDLLKIVVVDRYQYKPVSVGFIKGFGLTSGAIASSVAHDSHNVVAVGVEDHHIVHAINNVMNEKGGLSFVSDIDSKILPLPVGGIMSDRDGYEVASAYSEIEKQVINLGCALKAPFMTLSFMSLLVIPKLKIGDKGIFDGEKFEFISLFETV